jgi:hypothetical protein
VDSSFVIGRTRIGVGRMAVRGRIGDERGYWTIDGHFALAHRAGELGGTGANADLFRLVRTGSDPRPERAVNFFLIATRITIKQLKDTPTPWFRDKKFAD